MKHYFFSLLLIFASHGVAAFAAIPPGQAPAPTASPDTSIRFVDSIDIKLTAANKYTIYFDSNNTASPFKANVYNVNSIHLTASTVLRTTACKSDKITDCSDTAIYKYVKANPPKITIQTPTPGQIVNAGQPLVLKSTVSNPGTLVSVLYQKKLTTSAFWEDIGSPVFAPYSLSWTPAVSGSDSIRAIVNDGLIKDTSAAVSLVAVPNLGPSITWNTPASETILTALNGLASFTATVSPIDSDAATNGGGVDSVKIYDGPNLVASKLAAPWYFPVSNVALGDHVFTAKVYDNNTPTPATGVSLLIKIKVVAPVNQPPTVSITAPANNSFYFTPAADTIRITASDSDGSISKVDLLKNDITIGTLLTAPYKFAWTEANAGTNTFKAIAYDNAGASTTSTTLTLKTANNLPPTISMPQDTTIILPNGTFVLKPTALDPDPVGASSLKYAWSATTSTTQSVAFSQSNILNPTVTVNGNGKIPLSFKATDSLGASTSGTMNVNVYTMPSITSSLNVSIGTGILFSYTVNATGYPTPLTYTAQGSGGTALPNWLSIDSITGILSGTPTTTGTYSIVLTAKNAAGTDTKTLQISISDIPVKPTLTSSIATTGKKDSPFYFNLTAKGTGPISFSSGTLPPGLSLAPTTGLITGTPTAFGSFSVAVNAQNSLGKDSVILTIIVKTPPVFTTDLPDTVRVIEKGHLGISVAATGYPTPKYQWEFASASDPSGNFQILGGSFQLFEINSVSLLNQGRFRVTVSNDTGKVVGKTCVFIVTKLPTPILITSSPSKTSPVFGKSALLSVRATGDPVLKYQWFKNDKPLLSYPGSADSNLSFAGVVANDAGLYRARVTNSFTDTTNASTYAWSDTARISVFSPQLPIPKATPSGNAFSTPTPVTLTDDTAGTDIYYTINIGGDPTLSSPKYIPGQTVIMIDTNIVLRAKAYKSGFRSSDVMIENYAFAKPNVVFQPSIRPASPTFTSSVSCTLSTATLNAEIWYTLDGTDPRGVVNAVTHFPRLYTGPFVINATTTVIAFAKATGMTSSDTLNRIYTYIAPPVKAQAASATPGDADFNQTISVILKSGTDSSQIWYTTDASSPDTSSTKKLYPSTGLIFLKTTILRTIVLRAGYLKSDESWWTYNLVPLISANPASGLVFDKTLNIKLSVIPPRAVIRYTLDGSVPNALTSPIYDTTAGVNITGTTTISAIAIVDGTTSKPTVFSYTLKNGQLATPSAITPKNVTDFKDTLRVSLQATAGADIFYTLNGAIPTSGSIKYTGPIKIDSTMAIQAIAVQSGFQTSNILYAAYTLIPESPTFTPSGGSYALGPKVSILSTSKKASIYYTLDGSDPNPFKSLLYSAGIPISVSTSAVLKAVAVAGTRISAVHQETYSVVGVRDTVLKPSETFYLNDGYAFYNPDAQNAKVNVRLASADSLKLVGFDGVQSSIQLSLVQPTSTSSSTAFPKILFTHPTSEKRSLYQVNANGEVYFLSSRDTVTLDRAGIYFMGFDTLAPAITYLGDKIGADDSTEVSFTIKDNVANITYQFNRNDDSTLNTGLKSISSPAQLSFKLKHKQNVLKPLAVQIRASDYKQTSFLPEDENTWLSLSQSLGAFQGPATWNIGLNAKYPYDLISVPLALNPPITLGELGNLASDPTLQGVAWSNPDTNYIPLTKEEVLKPGQSYWIASHKRLAQFSMPAAKTTAQGKSIYSVSLHHGWNQVANPHLEKLYWPVSRALPEAYRSSTIKGLWAYNAEKTSFEEIDSLDPWRGYFVYNYLTDTTVSLSNQPITVNVLNKNGVNAEVSIALGWSKGKSLRLGAAVNAQDGIGIEDELPLPENSHQLSLHAVREGKALATDWIKLNGNGILKENGTLNDNGILEWKVSMNGRGDSLPPLQILEQSFPMGYETWAVSKSRHLKFKLVAGGEIAASGLENDTLQIYSGPASELAKYSALKGYSIKAPELSLNVRSEPRGFSMQIGLPSQGQIHASLWRIDGKNMGEMRVGPLAEGLYNFTFSSNFNRTISKLNPGVYFITVEISGSRLHSKFSRNLIVSD